MVAASLLCCCGCKGDEKNTIDSELVSIISNNNNSSNNEIVGLDVTFSDLESAIESSTFLKENLIFDTEYNQSIELDEEEGEYISYRTVIFTGKVKDNCESLQGEIGSCTVSLTANDGKDYPSNFSILFEVDNDIDFENMASCFYRLSGELFPPKLASAFQNASFSGLTEKCFSNNGLAASVYKEVYKSDSSKATVVLNILISEGTDEVIYTSKNEIKTLENGESDIHKLGIFGKEITLEDIEVKVKDLFKCDSTSVKELYIYNGYEYESAYGNFKLCKDDYTFDFLVSVQSNLDNSKQYINIQGSTCKFNDAKSAYQSIEEMLKELVGYTVGLSEIYSEKSGEITIDEGFGTPIKVSFEMQEIESKYQIKFTGTTIT